jgi:hypothetical protein
MIRVIHKDLLGYSYNDYMNLLEAYRSCKISDDVNSCRLLFNGLIEKIEKEQTTIRVSCNKKQTFWIQPNTSGPLDISECHLDCCHH